VRAMAGDGSCELDKNASLLPGCTGAFLFFFLPLCLVFFFFFIFFLRLWLLFREFFLPFRLARFFFGRVFSLLLRGGVLRLGAGVLVLLADGFCTEPDEVAESSCREEWEETAPVNESFVSSSAPGCGILGTSSGRVLPLSADDFTGPRGIMSSTEGRAWKKGPL